MAYKISDDCIMCGACAGNCPVGAISEGDGKYEINPDQCIECGACKRKCPQHIDIPEELKEVRKRLQPNPLGPALKAYSQLPFKVF